MSQNPPKPFWFDRIRPYLAALIFAIALGFRLIGIGWGLQNDLHNQSYHPDEEVIWTFSQAVEPAKLHFTPGVYNYGTLYLTLLRIGSDVVAGYGGGPQSNNLKSYWQYQARCEMVGRIISALAGALTAVFLFLMMRRFTRPLGAAAGGLFVAFAPGFVVHSRFQTVDVLATCLLAVSLYYSTLLLPDKNGDTPKKWLKYALLAGLFAGLSAGTKYTGILAIISLFVAIGFAKPEKPDLKVKAAFGGLLLALLGFIVGTPGVLLDTPKFMRDVGYELAHTATGHDLVFVGVGSGFAYHAGNLLEGVSILMLLMALIGIVLAAWRKQPWVIVLLAFAIPYYILIGRAEVFFLRYTFPLYPVLAAAFAWWIGISHERQGWHKVVVGLGILALGMGFRWSMLFTGLMSRMDPRDQTALTLREWSRKDPATRVGIVADPWYYTPALLPDSPIMRGGKDVIMLLATQVPQNDLPKVVNQNLSVGLAEVALLNEAKASNAPGIIQHVPANLAERFDWDSQLITADRPEYITFSSFEVGDVWRLRNRTDLPPDVKLRVDRFNAFYTLLQKEYEQVQPTVMTPLGFDEANALAHDLEYVHPVIWIWKRKDLH